MQDVYLSKEYHTKNLFKEKGSYKTKSLKKSTGFVKKIFTVN